ncbi:hypothetical protein [Saccharopolyspora sp. NPDC002376]
MFTDITANIVGLALAVALFLIMRRTKKMKKKPGLLVPAFAFCTGAVLASTFIGPWFAGFIAGFDRAVGVIVAAAALVLAFCIFADLKDGNMDVKATSTGLIVLPILALGGVGIFPDALSAITGNAGGAIVSVIGPLIGG